MVDRTAPEPIPEQRAAGEAHFVAFALYSASSVRRYTRAMQRYQRYILRQLVGPFLFITVGLTAVIWLTQSLRFIDLIVNKGLSLSAFVYLSMLLLPSFLGVILPVALFCAILFIYNKLIMDSELVSLRTVGLSPWALAGPALLLAAIVTVVVYAINMYFVPTSFREFKDRQFVIRSDYSSVLLQEGVFTTLIDDVTVYVRARKSSGELLGILVHDSRIAEQPVTMMAERGALVQTDRGPRFVLVNGNRQEINQEDGQLSDQRNKNKFWAEAHRRIATPLHAMGLTIIAMATLLAGSLNRRGQWRRILVGIGAAFLFEAVGLGLVNVVVKTPSLVPLMYLNVVAAIGGSLYVLFRRPRRASGAAEQSAVEAHT
jgi:lipopolysaccharide export system permease protein